MVQHFGDLESDSPLTDEWIGRILTYVPQYGPEEKGILKSYDNEARLAFIVYGHSEDPDWRNYTASSTLYEYIKELQ